MLKAASELWWEEITGPVRLTEALLLALQQGKSVVFRIDPDLPWRWVLRGILEQAIHDYGLGTVIIDSADEYRGGDLGEYLVGRIDPRRVADYLRARSDRAKFWRESGILEGKVVWAKGVPAAQAEAWLQFAAESRRRTQGAGGCLLELAPGVGPERLTRGLEVIRYDEYITPQDLQLFTAIVAARSGVPAPLRAYAAGVAANLCAPDPEAAEMLLSRLDWAAAEPVAGLSELLVQEDTDLRRGRGPAHPFALLRQGDTDALLRRVWTAQIQIAFPLIELERVKIINRYRAEIGAALETAYWNPVSGLYERITQYGGRPADPLELELGTLVYMMQVRRKPEGDQYLLYIPLEADRLRLKFLHRCRNLLAHLKLCTPAEMTELFGGGKNGQG